MYLSLFLIRFDGNGNIDTANQCCHVCDKRHIKIFLSDDAASNSHSKRVRHHPWLEHQLPVPGDDSCSHLCWRIGQVGPAGRTERIQNIRPANARRTYAVSSCGIPVRSRKHSSIEYFSTVGTNSPKTCITRLLMSV